MGSAAAEGIGNAGFTADVAGNAGQRQAEMQDVTLTPSAGGGY